MEYNGTWSTTTIVELVLDEKNRQKENKIVAISKQYDGYPKAYGRELAEFLLSKPIVDPSKSKDSSTYFLGINNLALQLVLHFSSTFGELFLYRGGSKDPSTTYAYEVIYTNPETPLLIKCSDVQTKRCIFKGTPEEFLNKFELVL